MQRLLTPNLHSAQADQPKAGAQGSVDLEGQQVSWCVGGHERMWPTSGWVQQLHTTARRGTVAASMQDRAGLISM